MSERTPDKNVGDIPKKRPQLPKGWEQLELPMELGHTRVITRKTPPSAK